MSKTAFKFFRFTSFVIGSLSLLALSSPWILSHPTCLQFACSLLSVKLGKQIECSRFQWKPFGKTEISSLSLSETQGRYNANLSINRLTIDDPLVAFFDYFKGTPIQEIFLHHAEIDSTSLRLNEIQVLELSSQKHDRAVAPYQLELSLFSKNIVLLARASPFFQNLDKESSICLLLDRFQETAPERLEIPVILDHQNSQLTVTFASQEVDGSIVVGKDQHLIFKGALNSSLFPTYRLALQGTVGRDRLHLDSSIVSTHSDGNSLFMHLDDEKFHAKIDLCRLHELFGDDLPATIFPSYLQAETEIGLSNKGEFFLNLSSDLYQGHFVGKNTSSELILEEGSLEVSASQIGSFFQNDLHDHVIPQSLSVKLGPSILSKKGMRVKKAEAQMFFLAVFPALGTDSVKTVVQATCQEQNWNAVIESDLISKPFELAFAQDASFFYVNLLEAIHFPSSYLAQALSGFKLDQSLSVEGLQLNELSFRIPLHQKSLSIADLKTEWTWNDLTIKALNSEFSTGVMQVSTQCSSIFEEWKALCKSGNDRFTIRYATSLEPDVVSGTLDIGKLPLGKWVHSPAYLAGIGADFKLDAQILHTDKQTFSFNMKGISPASELSLIGAHEQDKLFIHHFLYTGNSQEAKRTTKIKIAGLSYSFLQNDLSIADALLEDRIDQKSTLLGRAKSTELGLELDINVLDAEKHSRFHLEGLTKSLFHPKLLTDHKLEIQADHCPFTAFTDRKIPFSIELRALLGEEFTCSVQLEQGNLKSRFRSDKWMLSLSGCCDNDYFVSTKPCFAQVNLDNVALTQISKWIPSAAKFQFAHPLNLRIDEKSLKVPLADFQLREISAKGSLELGQFTGPNPSFGKPLLKLLKQKDSLDSLNLWFTPIDFQIDHGKVKIERVDFLVQNHIHLAFWGHGELHSTQMNYHLGIAQDTLRDLLGLQDLPHDFLLSLPLRYKKNRIDLDLKESFKVVEQFLLMQGSISGALPSWLDQFLQLGKHALLPYPPLQYKLPWAVAKEESTQKKSKNKLKPKNPTQETAKPQEAPSTVDKAKEWVELFKIFKVLN